MPISLQHWKVKAGDELSATQFNAFLAAVESLTDLTGGPGVRVAQLGSQVCISARQRSTAFKHPFKVASSAKAGGLALSFSQGFIGGVEPKIGDRRISEPDDKKKLPAITVTSDDINDVGLAFVFARIAVGAAYWQISGITIEAQKSLPAPAPLLAWKLLAIVVADKNKRPRSVVPIVSSNLGFAASNRKPSGRFRPWFWLV